MYSIFSFHYYFFNPHLRICLSILEKEGRENETSVWERNIDWLPPKGAPTRNQTHNLGMCHEWGSNPHFSCMGGYSSQQNHLSRTSGPSYRSSSVCRYQGGWGLDIRSSKIDHYLLSYLLTYLLTYLTYWTFDEVEFQNSFILGEELSMMKPSEWLDVKEVGTSQGNNSAGPASFGPATPLQSKQPSHRRKPDE